MKDRHSIALTSVWFALMTGLAEALLFGVSSLLLHKYTREDPQNVWMASISYMALFAIPALCLAFVFRRREDAFRARVSVTLFGFLSIFGLLQLVTRLHPLARLVLALGLSLQGGELARRHTRTLGRIVRFTTLPAAALAAVLGLGLNVRRALAERRALAALPAASQDAPNVLLLILDTVRASNLGLYGYGRPTTPRIDRLAQRGVRFARAVSPAPWTLPSHASVFSGRWPHQMSANWAVPFGPEHPTLAEALRAKGYVTGGFVANYTYVSRESGLSRGFSHYEDYRITAGAILSSSHLARVIVRRRWIRRLTGHLRMPGDKSAAQLNQDVLHWLRKRNDRPFFAFVNYFDAHEPYDPPAPFDTMFRSSTGPRNPYLHNETPVTPEEAQPEMDVYDGAIAYLDSQLGALFDSLEAQGTLRNTLVVLTSDHGEEFGEHGLLSHGQSLYLPALRIPLVMVFPDHVPAGGVVQSPVSTRDIPATVLDLLGSGSSTGMPGRSLARHWRPHGDSAAADTILSHVRSTRGQPDWYPASHGDMVSLVSTKHHFIRRGDGRLELYDLVADPMEQRNIADTPLGREEIARFDLLRSTWMSQDSVRAQQK